MSTVVRVSFRGNGPITVVTVLLQRWSFTLPCINYHWIIIQFRSLLHILRKLLFVETETSSEPAPLHLSAFNLLRLPHIYVCIVELQYNYALFSGTVCGRNGLLLLDKRYLTTQYFQAPLLAQISALLKHKHQTCMGIWISFRFWWCFQS